MKNASSGQFKTSNRSVRSGQFVLTKAKGEAISAVEGLSLSGRMRTTISSADGRLLSPEQRRALIKETLRKK